MNRLICLIVSLLLSSSSFSQPYDIAVDNMTGCAADVTVYAWDQNSVNNCSAYISNTFQVAANSGIGYTWANFASSIGWSGSAPGTNPKVTGFMVNYGTSCTSATAVSVRMPFTPCGSTCSGRPSCPACNSTANPRVCGALPAGGPFAGSSLCVIQDVP